MEAQLYGHYPDGDGCAITIGLKKKDIEEVIKIRDTIVTSMSMPYWNKLLKLLNNIIAETQKKDEQGTRYLDAQLRERI